MIKSIVEKLAKDIGMDIAHSDNEVQANLLNGFLEGLSNSITDHKLDTQICYIVDGLSEKSCKVLKQFVEFINLKTNE